MASVTGIGFALVLISLPAVGFKMGGGWGFANGVLLVFVLHYAVDRMQAKTWQVWSVGFYVGSLTLLGMSYGGCWTEHGFAWGLAGAAGGFVLPWLRDCMGS